MEFSYNELMIAAAAVLTTWILNNAKLREGLTEWYISRLGIGSYNIHNHTAKETIKGLKFEANLTDYDNVIKQDLYHFYTDLFLTNMDGFLDDILHQQKGLPLEELKRLIKNTMYDRLNGIQTETDRSIRMPDELQVKFDRFRNYLTMQHTYVIDNALQSSNKKLLLIQVFDAIQNNARWFLFYTTEMFVNFNGHFNALQRSDVFI
jgi:hypothetical protein